MLRNIDPNNALLQSTIELIDAMRYLNVNSLSVQDNQLAYSENDNRIGRIESYGFYYNEHEKLEFIEDPDLDTSFQTPPKEQPKNESEEEFFSIKKIREEIYQRLNLNENLKSVQIECNEETKIDLHKGNKTEIKNNIRKNHKRRKKNDKREKKLKKETKIEKTNDNKFEVLHDKKFNVNIMKTIKASMFNKYLLNFFICFLQIFNLISTLNIILKKLNYDEIIHNNTKRVNLNHINMKIVDFLSIDPFNKKIILKIILKYKDNYNKYINFIFKMTLRDYIKIFTFKKELEEYIAETDLSKEDIAKIKTIFVRADTLLNNKDFSKERNESDDKKKYLGKDDTKSLDNINNKTEIDCKYFSTFILYLFNFIYYYESMKKKNEKKNEKYDSNFSRKLFKVVAE